MNDNFYVFNGLRDSVIIEIVPGKLLFVLKTLITFITLH